MLKAILYAINVTVTAAVNTLSSLPSYNIRNSEEDYPPEILKLDLVVESTLFTRLLLHGSSVHGHEQAGVEAARETTYRDSNPDVLLP